MSDVKGHFFDCGTLYCGKRVSVYQSVPVPHLRKLRGPSEIGYVKERWGSGRRLRPVP